MCVCTSLLVYVSWSLCGAPIHAPLLALLWANPVELFTCSSSSSWRALRGCNCLGIPQGVTVVCDGWLDGLPRCAILILSETLALVPIACCKARRHDDVRLGVHMFHVFFLQ